MKRNLLKSLFVTLALVFTAIAAQAQCYIIGNDGKWLTNEVEPSCNLRQKKAFTRAM